MKSQLLESYVITTQDSTSHLLDPFPGDRKTVSELGLRY